MRQIGVYDKFTGSQVKVADFDNRNGLGFVASPVQEISQCTT